MAAIAQKSSRALNEIIDGVKGMLDSKMADPVPASSPDIPATLTQQDMHAKVHFIVNHNYCGSFHTPEDEIKKMLELQTDKPTEELTLDETYNSDVSGTAMDMVRHDTPFPSQRRSFNAIMERFIGMFSTTRDVENVVLYNRVYYADPVGSGKTLVAIAVVAEIIRRYFRDNCPKPPVRHAMYAASGLGVYGHQVETTFRKYFGTALVFVPPSVVGSWERMFKNYMPDLRVYTVRNCTYLDEVFARYDNDTLDEYYDVILVKISEITGTVNVPERYQRIYNRMKRDTYMKAFQPFNDKCWAAVVVDDFAELRSYPDLWDCIPALHQLWISSTNMLSDKSYTDMTHEATTEHQRKRFANGHRTPYTKLRHFTESLAKSDKARLPIIMPVRNSLAAMQREGNMFNINISIVSVNDPREKLNHALWDIAKDEVANVLAHLNAGSVEGAARAAGCEPSTSVSGIYKKMLGDIFDKWKEAKVIMEFLEFIEMTADDRQPPPSGYSGPPYGMEQIKKNELPEYNFGYLPGLINRVRREKQEIIAKAEPKVRRFKEAMTDNSCPICTNAFKGDDGAKSSATIVMYPCCSAVFCETCIADQFKTHSRAAKSSSCPNCKADNIKFNDIIIIKDSVMPLETLCGDVDLTQEEERQPADKTAEINEAEDLAALNRLDKFGMVARIAMGRKLLKQTPIYMNLGSVMTGKRTGPFRSYNKVLVFANYDESNDKMKADLDQKGIKNWKLEGTASQLDETAEMFNQYKGPCVLIVNAVRNCSGLNLQTATHVVFFHYLDNRPREQQVIGRGQRLGREDPLQVMFLCYPNEVDSLIRERSASYTPIEQ